MSGAGRAYVPQPPTSLGKARRLRQTTSARGVFTVLAIDHRGPLRRRLARESAGVDLDAALAGVKQDIVRELAPHGSAVLLDPEVGLGACVLSDALPGTTGLLVALDTGSTGDPAVLQTGLAEGWSAERIVRSGGTGAKLLVYYHPDTPDATRVEELVRDIGQACAAADLPLYLEPLSYAPGLAGSGLPSAERRRVVLETARRLVPLGADVLKAEFPVDPAVETDERVWAAACVELTAASPVPWVLLSAGVPYDVFLRQAAVACQSGASGVIAGRAVWNEAVTLDVPARREFLRGIGRERMERLRCLCEALGRPVSR